MKISSFHIFKRSGQYFLLRPDKMTCSILDKPTWKLLSQVKDGMENIFTIFSSQQLRRLDLFSEKNEGTFVSNPKETPLYGIALLVTQKCNLRCSYCYGDGGEYGERGQMTVDTAIRAVDWLLDCSPNLTQNQITFFGGEPLMNFPLIEKVVAYANKIARQKNREIIFKIATNSSLLDEKKLTYLKQNKFHVLASFDGPKHVHDSQRQFLSGRKSYDIISSRINRLLTEIPLARGRATVMAGVDPLEVRTAMRNIGFKTYNVIPASPCMLTGQQPMTLLEREHNAIGQIRYVEEEYGDAILETIKNRDIQALKDWDPDLIKFKYLDRCINQVRRYHSCGAGRSYVAVATNGYVYTCHRFIGQPKHKLGSISKTSLDRNIHLRSPISVSETCSRCFAKFFCGGGCKYDNQAMTNSMFEPDETRCKVMKYGAELIASIAARLTESDQNFLVENNFIGKKNGFIELLSSS